DGCGCPHEAVVTSCCCAEEEPVAPAESMVVGVPRTPLVPERLAAREGSLPHATLTSFQCSGGRSGRASQAGAAPAVASATRSVHTDSAPRSWSAKIEPGPLFDLAREPET